MTAPCPVPLFLIRHGATPWTAAGRYQGRHDTPLSALGRADAERIATRLRDADIGLVVASPLARARDTAAPLAAAAGAPLRFDERLIELDYGKWEGLTQSQVKALWPTALRDWKRGVASARPPGGEALHELQARVEDFLRALKPPARGAVAIVAHAWVVRVALLSLSGENVARVREIAVPPASVHCARLASPPPAPCPGELSRQAMS
ncbi:MAG: histidine phosphatase family protein [Pseudomonadota bacterium]|nr:histidine phosphatase family protein [Pseudomonadota bacterium]